ncbi:glycosyltransferase family 2 protein [Chitinophaga vietnamensis]|uniref:glycosyltransferase family 2 protein n=1 Tax=Chitinophaga vietnamensis TaxID=2593957 RepID=UPI001177D167|nr:glycosyltransferase family 2 protein [Chitinophaga vietnamensis]
MNIPDRKYPLVSIVVATYNGERFLEEQLDSLVHQTYPNLEIIVVDDGSKDKTPAILQAYAAKYPQLRVYTNPSNLGYVKNFEKGCSLATGDYISLADQDDVWDLEKTMLLMDAMEAYPMIYCDSAFVDEDLNSLGRTHKDLKNLQDFDNPLYFATDNCVGGHALIMKKEVVQRAMPFPVEMPHDLWLAFVATFSGTIKYFDQALVKWRQHGYNITSKKKDKYVKIAEARKRAEIFYRSCPPSLMKEKQVLNKLQQSYQSYSLSNNFLRMSLFFRYRHYFLAMKKRSEFRKTLFCLKMFVKLREHVA